MTFFSMFNYMVFDQSGGAISTALLEKKKVVDILFFQKCNILLASEYKVFTQHTGVVVADIASF